MHGKPRLLTPHCAVASVSSFLALTLILLSAPLARAEGVSADVDIGSRSFDITRDGGSSFFAYSRRIGPAPLPVNTNGIFHEHGVAGSRVPLTDPGVLIVVSGVLTKDVYGPVLGAASTTKPTKTSDIDRIDSYSPLSGNPAMSGTAGIYYSDSEKSWHASAAGRSIGPGKATGGAAGAVFDPVGVAPGSYAYTPTVNVDFELSDDTERGGINLYALDSRLTDIDTFAQRGQPIEETLWHLSIQAIGPSTDTTHFYIDFAINPEARAMGILNPAVSDSDILMAVENGLTVADGAVTLTSFSLFPEGTTFNVSGDGEVSYGVGSTANFVATPEPATICLALCGAVACFWHNRRRTWGA